jgi:hypothetical protein
MSTIVMGGLLWFAVMDTNLMMTLWICGLIIWKEVIRFYITSTIVTKFLVTVVMPYLKVFNLDKVPVSWLVNQHSDEISVCAIICTKYILIC